MSRITVAQVENPIYQTTITVQIGDINYGNHLANDAILRLCHEARIRWLANHQFSEINAGGCGLIMADAAIQYTAQSHHGDELTIEIEARNLSRSGFTLLYHIYRPRDQKTIAKAQTGMVCFNYQTQKVAPIPDGLRHILA